jgi:hypothetical protein
MMNVPQEIRHEAPQAAARPPRCTDWFTYAGKTLRQNGQQEECADRLKASK